MKSPPPDPDLLTTSLKELPIEGEYLNTHSLWHAQRIERWRDNVLDLDIAVDDTGRELDTVLDRFCALLAARTAARRELARLIHMARPA